MAENDAPNPELLALRVQIDALDRELLTALNRRAALAQTVGEVKKREGSVAFRPEREAQVIDGLKLVKQKDGPQAKSTEIWLAADRDYLPVRVLIIDKDGTRLDQLATKITRQ